MSGPDKIGPNTVVDFFRLLCVLPLRIEHLKRVNMSDLVHPY